MRISRHLLLAASAGVAVLAIGSIASSQTTDNGLRSGLRGNVPLQEVGPAPRMLPQANTDVREIRNYPEQPPVIPHTIEAYQLDANVNQCLSCHARSRTGESQAPMVSITHFMDRDGQFLAALVRLRRKGRGLRLRICSDDDEDTGSEEGSHSNPRGTIVRQRWPHRSVPGWGTLDASGALSKRKQSR